jgi:hypothetical protein
MLTHRAAFNREWSEKICSPFLSRIEHEDWKSYIIANFSRLNTSTLEYMLSDESRDKENWSIDVVEAIESELFERIALDGELKPTV